MSGVFFLIMEREIWKDVEGYEGLYQISSKGRVFSLHTNKILRASPDNYGYPIVRLSKHGQMKTITVHRLVAKAFLPNPDNKKEVDHIDANRSNNNVKNLRWTTRRENAKNPNSTKNYQEMAKRLRHWEGREKPIKQIDKGGVIVRTFRSAREAERETGIAHQSIAGVLKGKAIIAGGYGWEYIN